MESWKNGKEELLDELTKICNRIGDNVAAGEYGFSALNQGLLLTRLELDDENFATVARDELRFLREKSARIDDLAEENTRLVDELKGYDETALRVEDLKKENQRLTGALEKTIQQHKLQDVGTPGGPQTPGVRGTPSSAKTIEDGESKTVSMEEYKSIINTKREKLRDLTKRFNRLSENNKDLTSANQRLQEKYKEQKEDIEALRAKLKRETAPKVHASDPGISYSTTCAPASVVQVPRSPTKVFNNDTERRDTTNSRQSSVSDLAGPGPLEDGAEEDSPELPNLLKEGRFNVEETQFIPLEADHSSSTQDEPTTPNRACVEEVIVPDEQPVAEHPLSDDIPVIISTRKVNKRKSRHNDIEPSAPPKVKIENLDSSPLIGLAALKYNLNESIDLDDIGQKVDTPKKRRQMLELSRQASVLSNSSNSQQSLESPSHGRNNITSSVHEVEQTTPAWRNVVSETGSALQPLSTNSRILPRTSDDRPSKKRRLVSDKALDDLAEDGQEAFPLDRTPKKLGKLGPERLGGLLQKPSPPKRVLSPVHTSRTDTPKLINEHTRSKASATSGLAHEFRNFNGYDSDSGASVRSRRSRDSMERSRPSSKGTPRLSAETSGPISKGTSRGSMEPTRPSPKHPGPQVERLLKIDSGHPKTPIGRSRPTPRESKASVGRSGATPYKNTSHKAEESIQSLTKSTTRSRVDGKEPQWDNTPANEPLRTRPVQTLNLEDFKINLNYNQGYSYAFNEVVRGNDARRCLQGCTRPECCGNKLRAMAELSVDNGRPRTLSQEERDEELIADFMGGNAHKIGNMSTAEKKEMFLQAKTWEMANKNGKHRHAYERMRSPPGFWETDFPTTQEEMVNREKSKALMRDEVQQRYQQAMRPGGAYVFRDE